MDWPSPPGWFTHSPHGPATAVAPLLRAAVSAHLTDVFPGDRTVEQSHVATDRADGGRIGAGGVRVGGVDSSVHNWPGFAVRDEGLAIAGRPVVHVRDQHQARIFVS